MKLPVHLLPVALILTLAGCGGGEDAVIIDGPDSVTQELVARPDEATTRNGEAVTVDVLANDQAQGAEVSLIDPPTLGEASIVDNRVVYSPNPNVLGTDTFTYRASLDESQVSATVTVRNFRTLNLAGTIAESLLHPSTVSVSTADLSFSTVSDANGAFAFTIESDNPDDIIVLVAQGQGEQRDLQLVQMLGAFSDLLGDDSGKGISPRLSLAPAQVLDPVGLTVSYVTTALYSLLIEENDGSTSFTKASLEAAQEQVNAGAIIDIAAALKVFAEQNVARLMEQVNTLLDLVGAFEQLLALIDIIDASEALREDYQNAQEEVAQGAGQDFDGWPQDLLLIAPGQDSPIQMGSRVGDYIRQVGNDCIYYTVNQSMAGACAVVDGDLVLTVSENQQSAVTDSANFDALVDIRRASVPYTHEFFADELTEQEWAEFTESLDSDLVLTSEISDSFVRRISRLTKITLTNLASGNQNLVEARFDVDNEFQFWQRPANGGEEVLQNSLITQRVSREELLALDYPESPELPFTEDMLAGQVWLLPLRGDTVPTDAQSFPSPGWSWVEVSFNADGSFFYALDDYYKAPEVLGTWSLNEGELGLQMQPPGTDVSVDVRLIARWLEGFTAHVTMSGNTSASTYGLVMPIDGELSTSDFGRLTDSAWLSSYSLTNPDRYRLGRFSPYSSFGWITSANASAPDGEPVTGVSKMWGESNDAPLFQATQNTVNLPALNTPALGGGYWYLHTHRYAPAADPCWDYNFTEGLTSAACETLDNTQARMWKPLALSGDTLFVLELAQSNLPRIGEDAFAFDYHRFLGPRLNYYQRFDYRLDHGLEYLQRGDERFTNPYWEFSDLDGDGVMSISDDDIDGDGVANALDAFIYNPSESIDFDQDFIGDGQDKDDDNDGMPDSYEVRFGLDPTDASDALLDRDLDGTTNLQAYRNLTAPGALQQRPLLEIAEVGGGNANGCVFGTSGQRCFGLLYASDIAGVTTPQVDGAVNRFRLSTTNGCALASGTLQCWGREDTGVNQVPDTLDEVLRFDVAFGLACAIDGNSQLACWGEQALQNPAFEAIPEAVAPVKSIVVDQFNVCVLYTVNRIECWGSEREKLTRVFDNAAALVEGRIDSFVFDSGWACVHGAGEVQCRQISAPIDELPPFITLLTLGGDAVVKYDNEQQAVCGAVFGSIDCTTELLVRESAELENAVSSDTVFVSAPVFDFDISRDDTGDTQLCIVDQAEVVVCQTLDLPDL